MKKKNGAKSIIIWIVVLAFLGGALWWLFSTQENAVNKKLVLQIPEATIETINVTKIDKWGIPQEYTLKRYSANSWGIIKPIQDAANTTLAANIAKIFEKFEAENTIKDAGNLADYGLDKPMLTVQVNYQKKKSVKLLIGQETAIPGTYYAKLDNKPEVIVLGAERKTTLDNNLNFVREKKVADIDSNSVKQVEFKNKNTPYYNLVNNNNSWTLESPFREKVVQAKVVQVISSINSLNADDFGDDAEVKEYGFDNPEFWLELSLNNGTKVVVKANKYEGNYYLTTSLRKAIFKLASSQTLEWLYNPEDEIEKRMVTYAQNEVQGVKYQQRGIPETEIKSDILSKIWTSLSMLNVTGFYYSNPGVKQPAPIDNARNWKPVYRYTIERSSGNLVLSVYTAANGNEYLMTSSERQYIYKINKYDIDTLNQKIGEALSPAK